MGVDGDAAGMRVGAGAVGDADGLVGVEVAEGNVVVKIVDGVRTR